MQRRLFTASLSTGLFAAGSLSLPAAAQSPKVPAAGAEYRALAQPVAVEAPAGKIEVVEFFWYSCPHCNAFEPALETWSKKLPADVVLRRVPVAFRDDFVPQQRLFYTLEAMNRLDLHGKVFHAIHMERQPTNREESILAWAQKNGLDRAKFQEQYNSFSVQAKARRATQLQDAYRVEGVPALGVAGRFYTDGGMAGNMGRALQVVDYLIGQVRTAR